MKRQKENEGFLGITEKNENLKKKLFSPEKSIKNKKIQKHKFEYNSSIKLIEMNFRFSLYYNLFII